MSHGAGQVGRGVASFRKPMAAVEVSTEKIAAKTARQGIARDTFPTIVHISHSSERLPNEPRV